MFLSVIKTHFTVYVAYLPLAVGSPVKRNRTPKRASTGCTGHLMGTLEQENFRLSEVATQTINTREP